MKFRAAALLLLLWLPACQTTDIAPAKDATASLEDDERRLWTRAREEQETLDQSGFLIAAPEIEAYVNELLARLHSAPLAQGARLHAHLLIDPTLNAFALPDGTIYIHSGMLARLQNEAQLAAVLSHELTHATHRHALRGYRNVKNQTGLLASLTAGTGGAGALLGLVGAMSAISGYSKDLEREADETGFRLYVAAGYDPQESTKVFRTLLAESKRSKIKEPFFFGSHPRLEERITNFEQFVAGLPAAQQHGREGTNRAEAYEAVMAPVFLRNADAALRANDHDFARESAERFLRVHPDDPRALLLIADSRRKHAGPDDAAEALRLYRQLVEKAAGLPEAHRGLGLMLFKQGDKPAAAAAFHRYLELKPDADDRSFIENYLQQCAPKS